MFDRLESAVAKAADATGKPVPFWLRDDDAIAETAELRVFLGELQRYDAPAVLAVIPGHLKPTLAPFVSGFPKIAAAVHGWRHDNRAAVDQKKSEYPGSRTRDDVTCELREGRALIAAAFGNQAIGMFVPPWNRIAAEFVPGVADAGFATLSAYAGAHTAEPAAGVAVLNTHIDIIDWQAGRIGRSTAEVLDHAATAVEAYAGKSPAIGILTHHLVHDMDAHLALTALLDWIAKRDDADIIDIRTVAPERADP